MPVFRGQIPAAATPPPRRSRSLPNWIALVLGICYLAALGASHLERSRVADPPQPAATGKRTIEVATIQGEREVPGKVTITYRDVPALAPLPDKLPIILIHGSPGEADVFDLFMQRMNNDPAADAHKPFTNPGPPDHTDEFHCIPGPRELIAPDLPGFGDSSQNLPPRRLLLPASGPPEAL